MEGADKKQEFSFRQSMVLALGTALSRILGLARDVALANLFSRQITDAWVIAFRWSHFLRRVVGEGALSSVLYRHLEEASEEQKSEKQLIALFSLLALGLTLLLWAFGPLLLFGHFKPIGEESLTWQMFLGMVPFCGLILLNGALVVSLQRQRQFAVMALTGALLNGFLLVSLWTPALRDFPSGLAWAVSGGGALQTLWLLWFLRKTTFSNLRFPPLKFPAPLLRETLAGAFSHGIWPFVALINTYYAKDLGEGVISRLFWSDRLLELPLSLVSVSLGTSLVTGLALPKARKAIVQSLGLNLWLTGPCFLGLFFLADPFVKTLFDFRSLSAQDLAQMTLFVRAFSILVVVIGLGKVLLPVLFYGRDSKFVGQASAAILVAQGLLAPLSLHWMALDGLLALTVILQMIYTAVLLLRVLKLFPGIFLGMRFELPVLVGGLACGLSLWYFGMGPGAIWLESKISVIVFVVIWGLVYLGLSRWLRGKGRAAF